MAATARWCERSAQASISSRVTPASTAAFHPTVIDMSRLGVGRLGVAGRDPVLPLVGAQLAGAGAGHGGRRLDAAGDDHPVHAGADELPRRW